MKGDCLRIALERKRYRDRASADSADPGTEAVRSKIGDNEPDAQESTGMIAGSAYLPESLTIPWHQRFCARFMPLTRWVRASTFMRFAYEACLPFGDSLAFIRVRYARFTETGSP